jgi:hypothetical protein
MDNQNTDPNQVPVAPQQQTSYTQPQNVVPRKPNVKKGHSYGFVRRSLP